MKVLSPFQKATKEKNMTLLDAQVRRGTPTHGTSTAVPVPLAEEEPGTLR